MRLDKYLIINYPSLSRVYIKDQVRLGNFLVGGKKVKPSHMLSEDDQVAFAPGFVLPASAAILPNPDIKLNIIFENDDVIVIDKPAGLSVHPRQDKNGLPLVQEINNTLISGLLSYYPAVASVGDSLTSPQFSPSKREEEKFISIQSPPFEGGEKEGVTPSPIRPGIVHRLDKDTSGVMIIAKNQNSFDWLKKQFKERQATKKYLALVSGRPKEKQGEIKTLLQRASSDPTRQKVSIGEGKESLTLYKVIKEFKNYSLLEVSPKTGRLHQIRVHLTHLGHSVAGDAKYGQKSKSDFKGSPKSDFGKLLTRQFLHATEIEITLPDGQKHVFSAPLPKELDDILKALPQK